MNPQSDDRFAEFPTPAHGTRMPVPAGPNGRSNPRAIAVLAAVAGLVVGAALASGAWLLFDNEGGSSAPVSAPESVGDYRPLSEFTKESRPEHADRQDRYDRESSARLSEAHDGAGAVVRQYANEGIDSMFTLEIVRTRSPFPPYVPFTDPEELGLDKPVEEIVRHGPVACSVRNNPGGPTVVLGCLRTSDDLTVTIVRATSELGERPEEVAKLVDEVWSEVS